MILFGSVKRGNPNILTCFQKHRELHLPEYWMTHYILHNHWLLISNGLEERLNDDNDYINSIRELVGDVFRAGSLQMDFVEDFDNMELSVIKALNQLDDNKKEK